MKIELNDNAAAAVVVIAVFIFLILLSVLSCAGPAPCPQVVPVGPAVHVEPFPCTTGTHDCSIAFLDYDWKWDALNPPTWQQILGQAQHWHMCIKGPTVIPAQNGCWGRFDMDGDYEVDLRDYARWCNWASRRWQEQSK